MSNITIGQYFPGNSLLHKMDARMKMIVIVLMMVSAFICRNYVSLVLALAATLVLVAVSKIKLSVILKGIKPILAIVLITTIINLFYGSGEPIVQFWIFKITLNGINNALFMSLRILFLVIQGLMLTYTTTPTALTQAIESMISPLKVFKIDTHSVSMTMTIALRFIPTLVEEVDKITAAQKSRGAQMDSGGIVNRIKAIIPIIIPLFISSFRRAEELADAMECRCYRGGAGRTKMNVVKMGAKDYAALFVTILYLAAVIAIRVLLKNVI